MWKLNKEKNMITDPSGKIYHAGDLIALQDGTEVQVKAETSEIKHTDKSSFNQLLVKVLNNSASDSQLWTQGEYMLMSKFTPLFMFYERIMGVGDGVAGDDAVNKRQLDNLNYKLVQKTQSATLPFVIEDYDPTSWYKFFIRFTSLKGNRMATGYLEVPPATDLISEDEYYPVSNVIYDFEKTTSFSFSFDYASHTLRLQDWKETDVITGNLYTYQKSGIKLTN